MIASYSDPLKRSVAGIALLLAAAALALHPAGLARAGRESLAPFLTLALVIAAGLAAEHLGLFTWLARLLVERGRGRAVSSASVLLFTALVSGLVNLDVAVVVAVPLALRVARQRGLEAGFLALSVALTANATSFLLPTANLTNLLLLARQPLGWGAFVAHSWLAWILTTLVSVLMLGWLSSRHATTAGDDARDPSAAAGPALLLDLVPLFVASSSIRALLGVGLRLAQGTAGTAGPFLLAALVNNLPAASAIRISGRGGFWAAILGLAMGPNLLLTGSVASLIARALASRRGAAFGFGRFTVVGALMLPFQAGAAWAGLVLAAGFPPFGR